MAKALAAELARHGIRVNSVHPTGVNKPMGSGRFITAHEIAPDAGVTEF